jgi:hypothetical protein
VACEHCVSTGMDSNYFGVTLLVDLEAPLLIVPLSSNATGQSPSQEVNSYRTNLQSLLHSDQPDTILYTVKLKCSSE